MDGVTFDAETRAAAASTTSEAGAYAEATWETIELRRTIARAQEEVARLNLSLPEPATVDSLLEAAAGEAAATRPDRYEVGERLEEAARALKEAGALAGAGAALFGELRRATELLGPAGLATVATAL